MSMEWKPIETAPKDGTHMLLYAPSQVFQGMTMKSRLTYGYWSTEFSDDDESSDFWFSDDGGFTEENPPTHWMPLPAPPEVTK